MTDRQNKEYQTVILAALFHDVGKLRRMMGKSGDTILILEKRIYSTGRKEDSLHNSLLIKGGRVSGADPNPLLWIFFLTKNNLFW